MRLVTFVMLAGGVSLIASQANAIIPVKSKVVKRYVVSDRKVETVKQQKLQTEQSQANKLEQLTTATPLNAQDIGLKPVIGLSGGSTQLPASSGANQQLSSIKPLNGFKPLAPIASSSTGSGSLSGIPQLAPLTVTGDSPAPKAVSPLGEWLSGKFTWLDSLMSPKEVKPWQKATLAKPAMLPGGVTPAVGKFSSKVFISKEATLGGDGVSGGGCGCK